VLLQPLDPEADVAALRALPGIRSVQRDGEAWKLSLTEASDPPTVLRAIVDAILPARVELHRPSLEDIFIQMVTASGRRPTRGAGNSGGTRSGDERVTQEARR
jgi:ABC-type uncharacterized transport system ATPase subunit